MMANLSEDIQSAGSDTRPPMLDRSDFESWQQRPFKMGKFRETLADGALGPERDIVVKDLTPEERKRYKADIRATNILLQGLPKDIYTLINHYTNAKDIWDNVKMPLEGSELTRDERESQLYNDFEHFYQNKGETIHEYYGRQNRVSRNNARGAVAARNGGVQNRVGNANPGGQDSTFDDDVDEPPTMFMANLSSANPIYDEAGPSYDSDILSEVQDHDNYLDYVGEYHEVHEMQNDVQQNYVVDSNAEYTSDSNIIMYEQYVKNNA
ncbi:hypothetical protein Tco_0246123 [Tanacetum coccineum]